MGQIGDECDPIDHFLARPPVVGAVREDALDIAQAGNGRAAEAVQPGHAVQRDFDRYRDQPLHFLGAGTRVLGDHFDQGRCGVGIGFYVEVLRRIKTDGDQERGPEQHDQSVVQAPGDDRANHGGPNLRGLDDDEGCLMRRVTLGGLRRKGYAGYCTARRAQRDHSEEILR